MPAGMSPTQPFDLLALLAQLEGLESLPTVAAAMGKQEEETPMQKERKRGNKSPGSSTPTKEGTTLREAMGLAAAGAGATRGVLPTPPRAPGLPGGGRFTNIDPTTLLFLRSLMSGRR